MIAIDEGGLVILVPEICSWHIPHRELIHRFYLCARDGL
jgi:hypothetical protein